MWYKLNKDGTTEKVSRFIDEKELNHGTIKKTNIGKDIFISTVFLSLDHRMINSIGDPLLFETMIFGSFPEELKDLEEKCFRYTTFEKAIMGHNTIVRAVKKRLKKYESKI